MEQNRLIIGREKKILSDGLYYANGRGGKAVIRGGKGKIRV